MQDFCVDEYNKFVKIMGHSLSICAKSSEKLTFFTL